MSEVYRKVKRKASRTVKWKISLKVKWKVSRKVEWKASRKMEWKVPEKWNEKFPRCCWPTQLAGRLLSHHDRCSCSWKISCIIRRISPVFRPWSTLPPCGTPSRGWEATLRSSIRCVRLTSSSITRSRSTFQLIEVCAANMLTQICQTVNVFHLRSGVPTCLSRLN